ncbi:MAG: DNA-binding protein [Pseudomonadota bacterium]
MSQSVTRQDLQNLSASKLNDAELLFDNCRWANAYYLAGYAIELALKACAARQLQAETIPDKKLVNALYTHSFDQLVGLAGLRAELRNRQDQDSTFSANWGIVGEWTPDARYEATDKSSANFLIHAVGNAQHGVLPWIRQYW